jgi:hypothetical protein
MMAPQFKSLDHFSIEALDHFSIEACGDLGIPFKKPPYNMHCCIQQLNLFPPVEKPTGHGQLVRTPTP